VSRAALAAASAALIVLGVAAPASAQFDEYSRAGSDVASPEWFAAELRIGPYEPDAGAAFDDTFDDSGPLLELGLDVLVLRIPYVGHLGVGATLGWSRYTAGALVVGGDPNERADEETSLILLPLSFTGSLRIDVLARELGIPLVLVGRAGLSAIPWSSSTGEKDEGSGVSVGIRWAAQAALELDFFEPRAARALDEEWGINHSYLFFELYGSTASTSVPMGDPLTWVAGLGFVF